MSGHLRKAWYLAAALAAAPGLCAQQPAARVLPSPRLAPPPPPQEAPESAQPPPAPQTPPDQPAQPDLPKPLPTPETAPIPDAPPAGAPRPTAAKPTNAEPPVAESDLPVSPPLDRFGLLWQSSPFARNILPEQKTVESAEFSLLGVGGLGNKWCALVLDRKSQRRFLLYDDAPEDQDRLVRVNQSPSLDDVSAEIHINGASYVVKYDVPALKAQMVAGTAAPQGPGHVPAPAIKGAPAPSLPQPPATPVRVLPRRRYYPPSPSNKK